MESPIQGFDFQEREALVDMQGWYVVAPLALQEGFLIARSDGFSIVVRTPDFVRVSPR